MSKWIHLIRFLMLFCCRFCSTCAAFYRRRRTCCSTSSRRWISRPSHSCPCCRPADAATSTSPPSVSSFRFIILVVACKIWAFSRSRLSKISRFWGFKIENLASFWLLSAKFGLFQGLDCPKLADFGVLKIEN